MATIIRKACYLFFYKLYCFFESINVGVRYISSEWRTNIYIAVLEGCVFSIILIRLDMMYPGHFINPNVNPLIYVFPTGIVLAFLNYYFFINHGKWKKYINEFEDYSKSKKIITSLIALIVAIGLPLLLIFTLY